MNTKIVYVVTSNESDLYLDQTLLSVYSLRKKEPSAIVELVTDKITNSTIKGKRAEILKYINKKIVVDVPEKYNQVQTSRYIKTSLRQYIEGDFLFIDSDTIITDKLSDIDFFEGSIGMVLNVHVPLDLQFDKNSIRKKIRQVGWTEMDDLPYYNSGIIFVKDDEKGHRFYQEWHNKWKETLKRHHFHYDQPSLTVANAALGFPVHELDGVWNCQIMNNGLPFLNHAKIIHYFANHAVTRKNADKAYLFHDNSLYTKIKEEGTIPPDVSQMIDDAKSAFVLPCRIAVGNELPLLSNSLFKLSMSHSRIYKFFDFSAKIVLKLFSFVSKF